MATRYRLPIALAVVLVWIAITVFWDFWRPHVERPLTEAVTDGLAWNIVTAAIFLAVVVRGCNWNDMGFGPPRPPRSLWLLWLPLLLLSLFIFVTTYFGWPEPQVTALVAANTLFVGFSEELAFRGVLFRALLTRMRIWPAIWITTFSFGAVHTLNALSTGDWPAALTQAVAASMSGLLLMAVMLRTGSIVVAMLLHALWDFATIVCVLSVVRYAGISPADQMEPASQQGNLLILPLLFLLPNLLYALFLLRKVGRQQPA
jgi:membrane protease YdiL (CAAX protease family)